MTEVSLGERGQILVVGGMSSNFSQEHRNNPRVIFWSITKNSQVPDKIPCRVVIVIFSRFISHAIRDKVLRMAKSAEKSFYRICENTGEIRRHIDELLLTATEVKTEEKEMLLSDPVINSVSQINTNNKTKQEVTVPEPEPPLQEKSMKEKEKGDEKAVGVSDFIRKNANFNPDSPQKEFERLLELAKEKGIYTTPASIANAFYVVRKKQSKRPEKNSTTKNSAKFLAEFVGNLELAIIAIQDILDENERLAAENQELKKDAATMEKVKKLFKES